MFYSNKLTALHTMLIVEVGDWSRDGHNESKIFPLHWEGLHPGDDAQKMFENFLDVGAKTLGVDRININVQAPFRRMGMEMLDSTIQNDGEVGDVIDFVFLVYLQACVGAGVALPITRVDRSSSKIGGYGLFSAG